MILEETDSHNTSNAVSSYQAIFQEAVKNGDTRILKRLLEDREGKVNVNLYDVEGQTALHHCCQDGNFELVKLLIRFGADTHLANRDGWNCLHIASFGGYKDICLYLINIHSRRR